MTRGNRGYNISRGRGMRGSFSWRDPGKESSSSRNENRFPSWKHVNSSFESRSRYGSSNYDRYGSGSHNRDESYRRSYRSPGSSTYPMRNSNNRRSPDRNSSRYESSREYTDRRSFRNRDDYRKPRSNHRGSYRGTSSRGIRKRYPYRRGAVLRSVIHRSPKKYDRNEKDKSYKEENWDESDKEEKKDSWNEAVNTKDDENWDEIDEDEKKENWDEADEENWNDDKNNSKEKSNDPDKDDKENKEDSDKSSDEESPTKSKEKDDKKSISEDEDGPRSRYTGRRFIRLTCVHCDMKCITFKQYSDHLLTGRHLHAMRKVAMKQKATVARMRFTQRNAQRELEKDDTDLMTKSNYCVLCKLSYRQMKSRHQSSEAHRKMKKFLMPHCSICYLTFKSPMLYEEHLCSLEHIKRKAVISESTDDKHESEKDPGSPKENVENFMTVDSIGDVDEEEEYDANKGLKSSPNDSKEMTKQKKFLNIGAEHVRKMEAYYCDLCRKVVPNSDKSLKIHCLERRHLKLYIHYKKDKQLRMQAEKIHHESEKKDKEVKEKKDINKDEEKKDKEQEENLDYNLNDTVNDEDEEKVWSDLGDILAKVQGEDAKSDENNDDEDSNLKTERYDRFRLSEKERGNDLEIKPVKEEQDLDESTETAKKPEKEAKSENSKEK